MAELATIARPYAEALFKACADKGASLTEALSWTDELAAIAADPEMRQLADNPNVSNDQVVDVMAGVTLARGWALSDLARNFLRTLVENRRLEALPEVAKQFRALVNRGNGSSDALVYSAFPMDDSALNALGAVLEKRFGRKLNLSTTVDDSLIGGVRVVVGDEVLDTSVKARLEQMRVALTA